TAVPRVGSRASAKHRYLVWRRTGMFEQEHELGCKPRLPHAVKCAEFETLDCETVVPSTPASSFERIQHEHHKIMALLPQKVHMLQLDNDADFALQSSACLVNDREQILESQHRLITLETNIFRSQLRHPLTTSQRCKFVPR